jgi:hypothetical protein
MSDTTITRRSLIGTGTLTAIAAGLLGTAGTATTVAAAPDRAVFDLVAVLGREDTPRSEARFQEWLVEWRQEVATARQTFAEAEAALSVYVPADRHHEVVNRFSDAYSDLLLTELELTRELVFRHVPGLEPVLRLLWQHAMLTVRGNETDCGVGGCVEGV